MTPTYDNGAGGLVSLAAKAIDTAPLDGTRILVWVSAHEGKVPRPGRPPLFVQWAGYHALVRWYDAPDGGYWSTHPKGQSKLRLPIACWWPLPEAQA
jgi:hypothetical protein